VPDDVRRLSREQARRIAVRAQLLDAQAPDDLLSVVDRLTFLQLDPTDAVAPSADLVAWSRLGSAYRPEQLRHARPALVGNAGVPATIEGTPGSWRVEPEASAESF